jgi:ribulose-5-phosphate 4-epimerase/fuculose-1-phosphate aldolase
VLDTTTLAVVAAPIAGVLGMLAAYIVVRKRFPGKRLLELLILAPFAIPGTQDVPESLAPFLPDHDVILLSRHGALCLGATVAEAVDRMETLERVARIAVTARAMGGCEPLTAAQVEAVLRAAGKPPRRQGRA